MARTPVPKAGCYTSAYPSTQWQGMPCSTAETHPHPRTVGAGGSGGDISAQAPQGSLFSANGLFGSVTGVASVCSVPCNGVCATNPTCSLPGANPNAYSLQLNTNTFPPVPSTLCDNPSCVAWQQYSSDSPGNVYIQYWLLKHGNSCPPNPANFTDTWHYFAGTSNETAGCFINGNQAPVPSQPITALSALSLVGSNIPGPVPNPVLGGHSATVGIPASTPATNDTIYGTQDDVDLLGIGAQWNIAEFNVFGLRDGEMAIFNSGSTVVVRTVINGTWTTGGPSCQQVGYTAESNNLSLVKNSCSATDEIVFTETNVSPIPSCNLNAVTTCVAETGSNDNISEVTFTVDPRTCPISSPLSMQIINNGSWISLPQHCSDGSAPGICSPSAVVKNEFVLGTQKYGDTQSGAGIGTTQTVEVCNGASQCSQFQLTIPQCPSLRSANDQLSADEIWIGQGSTGTGRIFMNGPWVAADNGIDAKGRIWNLPQGCTAASESWLSKHQWWCPSFGRFYGSD